MISNYKEKFVVPYENRTNTLLIFNL